MFDEMEKTIKNVMVVEGPEIDHYTLTKLCSCIITLMTVYEDTGRFEKLISSCVKGI